MQVLKTDVKTNMMVITEANRIISKTDKEMKPIMALLSYTVILVNVN